nr:anthocyanidin 3-O-glucosyltransferase 2-like [Ipomoea batatas]
MSNPELAFIPWEGMGHLVPMVELAKLMLHRNQSLSISILVMRTSMDFGADKYLDSVTSDSGHPRLRFLDLRQYNDPDAGEVELNPDNFLFDFIDKQTANALKHDHEEDTSRYKNSDEELSIPCYANPVPAKALPATMVEKNPGTDMFFDGVKSRAWPKRAIAIREHHQMARRPTRLLSGVPVLRQLRKFRGETSDRNRYRPGVERPPLPLVLAEAPTKGEARASSRLREPGRGSAGRLPGSDKSGGQSNRVGPAASGAVPPGCGRLRVALRLELPPGERLVRGSHSDVAALRRTTDKRVLGDKGTGNSGGDQDGLQIRRKAMMEGGSSYTALSTVMKAVIDTI